MDTLEISTFRVRNFKSIKDSGTIDIDDLNILIGKNDAGKSTMLEALCCFLQKKKPDSSQFHKQDEEEIVFTATFIDVSCHFHGALGDDYEIDSDTVKIERRFEHRDGGNPSSDTFLNGEKLSKGVIVDGGTRLSKAQSRNYIWKHFLPDPIWISAERDVREETKLKGGTVLNRLLEPILKEGGIEEDGTLQNKVDELEDSLTVTAGTVSEDLTDRMQSHMPDIANIEISPGSVSLSKAISPTISIKDEYLDQSVDIAERGSGVGSLLVLSLMQTYVEMQVGEGYCLLFEEPGNFLHPAAERKMLSALKEISSEGQVCISTHSQAMIDQEKDASMHIVRRKSGETSFEFVEENTFAIIDEIGARNSDLLQSDFVIYVEGPSDIGVLNEVAHHAVPNWDSYNIVIQHLGGTGNLVHCDPEKLEKINRNFALLLDSDQKSVDGEPKDEVTRIKANFDEYGKRCDVLDRREIENYYSCEAVSDVCHVSVSDEFIGAYDDIEEKLNTEMDDGYSFDKTKHGRQIVDHMYSNGGNIEPVESLLKDCVEEVQ